MKLKNQIDRVNTLSEMIKERLTDHEKDIEDREKWEKENPKKYWYPGIKRTTPSEIKRLMLVQRQEMIKLEKML